MFYLPPADILCPRGGRIHLGSWRCYWLTGAVSPWVGAQGSCREMPGGDLASAGSLELQHFIHSSFPQYVLEHLFRYPLVTLPLTSPFHMCVHWNRKTTVWIWVKESGHEMMDPVGFSWRERGGENQEECVQMALGTPGQWRKAPCSGRYLFLCENDVTSKIYTLVK